MFRFTIRELVLVTITVAMGVGWWLDRNQQRHKHDKEVRQLLMKYVNAYEIRNGELIILKD
jgi:hypothetical protein